MQLSDYHYLGFIMGDRNLQKIIHTAFEFLYLSTMTVPV